MTGCPPKKFVDSIMRVKFISEECEKSKVNRDYIKRIIAIVSNLVSCNEYLAEEFDPV